MKIDFDSLTRTNLGFPSEWVGKSTEGGDVKISYRCGKTVITHNGTKVATLSLDQFDIGGYMDDSVLRGLLQRENFID
jgi:hypothetical protein